MKITFLGPRIPYFWHSIAQQSKQSKKHIGWRVTSSDSGPTFGQPSPPEAVILKTKKGIRERCPISPTHPEPADGETSCKEA